MMKQLFIYLFLCGFLFSVNAQENDYRALQKQQRDLLLQIEETTVKLNAMDQDVNTSLEQLRLISQKVQVRKQYIEGINREIRQAENEIDKIKLEIDGHAESLEKEKSLYTKIVRSMQKNSYFQNNLLFILSAKSIAQSYRRFEYLREIYAWQRRQLKAIKDRQDELLLKQKELESKRDEKLALLSAQQKQDIQLFEEEKAQMALVENLKSKRGALQAELKKQEAKEIDINKLIEQAITQGTNDGLALTSPVQHADVDEKDETPQHIEKPASNFGESKGTLPSPVSGKYSIVSRFGDEKTDEQDKKTKNGGIDIRTSTQQASAVSDGEISAVFASDGYNNIIVKHGDYLTVYANLNNIFVKKGDPVSAGQALGTINKDPETGDAILHFQVRKGKEKLNPEEWLRKN